MGENVIGSGESSGTRRGGWVAEICLRGLDKAGAKLAPDKSVERLSHLAELIRFVQSV